MRKRRPKTNDLATRIGLQFQNAEVAARIIQTGSPVPGNSKSREILIKGIGHRIRVFTYNKIRITGRIDVYKESECDDANCRSRAAQVEVRLVGCVIGRSAPDVVACGTDQQNEVGLRMGLLAAPYQSKPSEN